MGIIIAIIVVTILDSRNSRAKQAQPSNREWVIVIQGVNALGWAILLFIILVR